MGRRVGIRTAIVTVVAAGLGFALWYLDRPMRIEPAPEWLASVDRPDLTREQIMVPVAGAVIEAEVLTPAGGAAQKPAVVFTPGSGDSLVQAYAPGFLETYFQDIMLPRDIVLVYANKRGMGGSTGSFYNNTLQGRADDIYAVVEAMRGRDDIDPERIGVAGHSQGGWVVQILAAQHPDLAFMIDFMGPVRSTWAQFDFMHEAMRQCDGMSQQAIERQMPWKRAITRVANAVGQIYPAGQLGFDAHFYKFDPTPLLPEIEVPSLFVFGERDVLVGYEGNRAAFDAGLGTPPPAHLRFLGLPGANHRGFLVEDMCDAYDKPPSDIPSEDLRRGLGAFLDDVGLPVTDG